MLFQIFPSSYPRASSSSDKSGGLLVSSRTRTISSSVSQDPCSSFNASIAPSLISKILREYSTNNHDPEPWLSPHRNSGTHVYYRSCRFKHIGLLNRRKKHRSYGIRWFLVHWCQALSSLGIWVSWGFTIVQWFQVYSSFSFVICASVFILSGRSRQIRGIIGTCTPKWRIKLEKWLRLL